MKEIGQKLKFKREENGVSLDEAASDLKMRVSQLESIEEGRQDDFKDVFSLKYFIRDYAKYLGLDGESMLDEFNEYLFEQTSRISLEEIEEARRQKEEREKNMKILSPYTVVTNKDKKKNYIWLAIVLVIILISMLIYVLVCSQEKNDFVNENMSYRIGE